MEYRFFTYTREDGCKVTKALSSYAGRPISGKAICHPNDTFDEAKGRELAVARCDEKIARKRCQRALDKYQNARGDLGVALEKYQDTSSYLLQVKREYNAAQEKTLEILKNF